MKKKLLLSLICTLLGAMSAMALEAYVERTSRYTLTFKYGTRPAAQQATTYSLNEVGGYSPGWYNDGTYQNVTTVVFDPSFDEVRPQTTLMWFEGMANLTSITGWQYLHTDEVFQMNEMFQGCTSLTELDLSHFNTSNLQYMDNMFTHCTNLSTIYVSTGWTTANVSSSKLMFYGCTNLVGSMGTTYDPNHTDKDYAHIDLGQKSPGYLSRYYETAPYAIFTPGDSTLTFSYGPRPAGAYEMNTDSQPAWCTDDTRLSVARVVFNPSFAQAHPTSTYAWFRAMPKLKTITGWEYLNTDAVTTMFQMFYSCPGLTTLNLSHFNTGNVTDMRYMFAVCTGLTTLDLSSFNTGNVKFMDYMFAADVSSLSHSYNSNLTTILVGSGWNTNSVTSSNYMFDDCFKLMGGMGTTYDASHIDKEYARIDGGTSNPGYFTEPNTKPYAVYDAATTTLTFKYGTPPAGAYALNEGTNQPGWVTDHTNQSVTKVVFDPSFDYARPVSTYLWFYNMTNLTSISGWEYFHTSEVVIMRQMFQSCTLETLDLTHFITTKLQNTYSMFNSCANLKTVYVSDGWNVDNVTNSSYMFYGCTSLVGGMGTTYDANHINKAYAHIDGGTSNPGYFTNGNLNAYAQYNHNLHTLVFYCAESPQQGTNVTNYNLNANYWDEPEWFTDSTCRSVTKVIFDASFALARPITTYHWFADMTSLTNITGWQNFNTGSVQVMGNMFENCGISSLDLSTFNTKNVVNMIGMFMGCQNLTNLNLSSFNTSNVLSTSAMFYDCRSLTTLDLSHFNTSNVTDMTYMFGYCINLEDLNVSNFNTDKVTDMSSMFAGCGVSNLDLSNFNTGNVTDMQYTFAHCTSLTELDLSSFNTGKVVSFASMLDSCANLTNLTLGVNFKADNATMLACMFANCSSLTSLNLSHFNPVKAKTMVSMFNGCSSLTNIDMSNFGNTEALERIDNMFRGCSSLKTLDLSNFYTGNVADMFCTFYDCNNLKTIYVGNQWSTANVTSSALMFHGCTSLVGGQGTTFDPNHTDDAYAHIDGGTSNPGYFTEGPAGMMGDANGDGNVDVLDVTAIINYVLGKNPSPFFFDNANVNGDDVVNVLDVTTIINMILDNN